MSRSTVRAGAAYEAVLVDNVTKEVDGIVKSLDRLQAAFKETGQDAANLNKQMKMRGQFGRVGLGGRGGGGGGDVMGQISKNFRKTAAAINTAGQAIGQAMIHVGSQIRMMGVTAAAGAASMGFFFQSFLQRAGDAEETFSAFNAVFRNSSKEVDAWAKNFGSTIGRSVTQTRQGLLRFQSFFVGMGFGADEAANLSKSMQSLAVDFASFFNLTDEEGIARFMGGISGQSENLLRFGINVQESALSLTDYARALGKSSDQMTQFEKANARMEIIVKTMKAMNAEGDAFRTRFSFQNQLKAMNAQLANMAEVLGKELIPMVKPFLTIIGNLAKQFKEFGASMVKSLVGLFAALGIGGASLLAIGTAMSTFGVALLALSSIAATVAGILGIAFATGGPIAAGITALVAGLATSAGIKFGRKSLLGFLSVDFLAVLTRIKTGLEEFVDTTLQGFKEISAAIDAGEMEYAWYLFVETMRESIGQLADVFVSEFKRAWDEVKQYAEDSVNETANNAANKLAIVGVGTTGGAGAGRAGAGLANALGVPTGGVGRMVDDSFSSMFAGIAKQAGAALRVQENEDRKKNEALIEMGKDAWEVLKKAPSRFLRAISPPDPIQPLIDELKGRETPDASFRGPLLPAEVTRMVQSFASVGGMGAGFATQASGFAPVLGPIERETQQLNETARQSLIQLEKIAGWTDNFGVFT